MIPSFVSRPEPGVRIRIHWWKEKPCLQKGEPNNTVISMQRMILPDLFPKSSLTASPHGCNSLLKALALEGDPLLCYSYRSQLSPVPPPPPQPHCPPTQLSPVPSPTPAPLSSTSCLFGYRSINDSCLLLALGASFTFFCVYVGGGGCSCSPAHTFVKGPLIKFCLIKSLTMQSVSCCVPVKYRQARARWDRNSEIKLIARCMTWSKWLHLYKPLFPLLVLERAMILPVSGHFQL